MLTMSPLTRYLTCPAKRQRNCPLSGIRSVCLSHDQAGPHRDGESQRRRFIPRLFDPTLCRDYGSLEPLPKGWMNGGLPP